MAGTWTRLTAKGETKDLDRITAVMSMVDNGLMIEDYSDLSTNGMYGELIDEKLLTADRTKVAVSCFLPEEKHPKDTLAFLRDRFAALGIPVTFEIEGLHRHARDDPPRDFSSRETPHGRRARSRRRHRLGDSLHLREKTGRRFVCRL